MATAYNISDNYDGIGIPGVSISGTITTDGTIGILSSADILAWNITLNDGLGPITLVGPGGNSVVDVEGSDLTATATELLWNSSDSTSPSSQWGIATPEPRGFPGTTFAGFSYFEGGFVIDELICPPGVFCGSNPPITAPRLGNDVVATSAPLPATLPLFATGLGGLGLLDWRLKRRVRAVA